MENFEYIVKIEPKINYSSTSIILPPIESDLDFIYSIQKGKSLDDLFLNIEEKQKKLIRLVSDCIICLSFSFSNNINRKKFLSPNYSENILNTNDLNTQDILQIIKLMENNIIFSSKSFTSEKSLIDYTNNLCGEYFKIYESGAKSKSRAIEKTIAKLNGNHTLLNDIVRITISPLYPEYFDCIIDYLLKTNNIFFKPKQWTIAPSGILHNNCYLNIDGNIGQIAIDERLQRETNINCSHKIYEVMRLMESEDFEFSLKHINKDTINKIMNGYNNIMGEYGQIIDLEFNKIYDIILFEADQLYYRYKELILLHQSIHINAICNVDERWQELYCNLMMDMNEKNRIQHKEKIFPEFLLEKIPKYKEVYRFKFARIKENSKLII